MKRDEILGMKPGRELDVMVRQHIFNWNYPTYDQMKLMAEKQWEVQPECVHFMQDFDAWKVDGEFYWEYRAPQYSTDISAAWKVVEKMKGTATWYGIESHAPGHRAVFRVKSQRVDEGWYEAVTESAPEAICKAALLAVLEESH